MNIAVFCSANSRIDSDFFTMTEELGKWMANNGHILVYGGSNQGLMECIGKAVHQAGGQTIGVIPSIMEKNGKVSDMVDVSIMCDNLSDRKDLMLSHSDIAVALPGGIGTMDEIFTLAASHTIGYHRKKVILYNMDNFWKPLINVLNHFQDSGFIRGDYHNYIEIAESLEDIKKFVEE